MVNALRTARIKAESRKQVSVKGVLTNALIKFLDKNNFEYETVSVDENRREYEIEYHVAFDPKYAEESQDLPKNKNEVWAKFEGLFGSNSVSAVSIQDKGPFYTLYLIRGKLPPTIRSIRSRTKMFNLMWVNEQLSAVMSELANESKREPEIASALSCLLAAKQLFAAYEKRIGASVFKSIAQKDADTASQLRGIAAQLRGGTVNKKIMRELEDVLDTGDFPQTRSSDGYQLEIQKQILAWEAELDDRKRTVIVRSLIDSLSGLQELVESEGDDRIVFDNKYRRSIASQFNEDGENDECEAEETV